MLIVVGNVFCKILNNRLVQCLDKKGALHEGRLALELKEVAWINVYTLNEIVQGRLREDKKTYAFFLDIQNAYDSVWQELLDDYEDFESLNNVEKSSYVLGSELWESKFDGLLALVKEYIVDVWEIRKHKLYDSDSGSGLQCHTQSSPGKWSGKFSQNGKFDQNGKFSQNGSSRQKGKVHLGPNVSSFAHYRGCVVNGSGAMAAI